MSILQPYIFYGNALPDEQTKTGLEILDYSPEEQRNLDLGGFSFQREHDGNTQKGLALSSFVQPDGSVDILGLLDESAEEDVELSKLKYGIDQGSLREMSLTTLTKLVHNPETGAVESKHKPEHIGIVNKGQRNNCKIKWGFPITTEDRDHYLDLYKKLYPEEGEENCSPTMSAATANPQANTSNQTAAVQGGADLLGFSSEQQAQVTDLISKLKTNGEQREDMMKKQKETIELLQGQIKEKDNAERKIMLDKLVGALKHENAILGRKEENVEERAKKLIESTTSEGLPALNQDITYRAQAAARWEETNQQSEVRFQQQKQEMLRQVGQAVEGSYGDTAGYYGASSTTMTSSGYQVSSSAEDEEAKKVLNQGQEFLNWFGSGKTWNPDSFTNPGAFHRK